MNGTDEARQNKPESPHLLHLSGTFIGNIRVLARAQIQLDDKGGCVLKIAVRSSIQQISQLVADCIK